MPRVVLVGLAAGVALLVTDAVLNANPWPSVSTQRTGRSPDRA
jgi:hypothetical protein